MTDLSTAGTFPLGDRAVRRMGYGAMQLAGPHVFGPPKDRAQCVAVLREAVASGVDHIDTSDFYGPHVTNAIIREALHPYPDTLTVVTKVGARRDDKGAWLPAQSPAELVAAVDDNRRNLDRDRIDVVNLRIMGGGATGSAPTEGSIAERVEALAGLKAKGIIGHVGLSTVTSAQVAEARGIVDIVCVQNLYNIANRDDDALIDELATAGIAYVPYFPLGGFSPLQSEQLSAVATRLGASPLQVALAWLLRRSPNILLIPGTSSVVHLRENLAAAALVLGDDDMAKLSAI